MAEARANLRRALARRGLEHWLDDAVVAASVADALGRPCQA